MTGIKCVYQKHNEILWSQIPSNAQFCLGHPAIAMKGKPSWCQQLMCVLSGGPECNSTFSGAAGQLCVFPHQPLDDFQWKCVGMLLHSQTDRPHPGCSLEQPTSQLLPGRGRRAGTDRAAVSLSPCACCLERDFSFGCGRQSDEFVLEMSLVPYAAAAFRDSRRGTDKLLISRSSLSECKQILVLKGLLIYSVQSLISSTSQIMGMKNNI